MPSALSLAAAVVPRFDIPKGKKMKSLSRRIFSTSAVVAIAVFGLPLTASAESAAVIDGKVADALKVFAEQIDESDVFLNQAAGYLVFPRVIKVGVGIGGETGEGALRVGGHSVGYYRTASGSIGFQLGAQAKSIVIAFMTKDSLEKFRASDGWSVGIDGSVALIDVGAGKTIDTNNIKDPVVGFIFGSKGLMYNLTLEGSKITKLDKS
jgi:lipid-binding SYLF domain-containing protein